MMDVEMKRLGCSVLNELIYRNSCQWLIRHIKSFHVKPNTALNLDHQFWLYENTINQIISLPYSEERLALVTYLHLNHGTFPPALRQTLATQNRSRIWFALFTAETEQVTQKQCAHLAEVFGLFDADYAEQDSGNEVNETRTIYCF